MNVPSMENIHQVLYTIVNLYMKSETTGSLPPSVVDHIGKFLETLHKIFCQSEINTLLTECQAGLYEAFGIFKIETGVSVLSNVEEMKKAADTMHKELLELISTLSDATISETSSSIYSGVDSQNRYVYTHGYDSIKAWIFQPNSFSMLPSKPQIFYGRESELQQIMELLQEESPRIAILGAGGMSKTSLARAVLHHPDTSAKFEHRFFVSAESATNSIELAALIGLHVGLNPGKDLIKPVVHCRKLQCLVILDNLETPWEPPKSRGGIEEFLSLLTDILHVALIVSAERPGKVAWSHPFFPPLQPLVDDAAHQIFVNITDNCYEAEDINQLLQLTDNMPPGVDLIAHLADYEGFSNVVTWWEAEKTTMLSVGYDRKSNLDVSIQLSLSSPRITSESMELLSLLSILPDGLSDVVLAQRKLPIPNILACKATLLATSLAYQDSKKRLRLVPIREYIQQFPPPS
ncbi:hypothetical protein B0H14DRAFT_3616658, partial [Mycena olivaceomarginata]